MTLSFRPQSPTPSQAAGPSPTLLALAAEVPSNIRFGTSSWPSDGWAGDVYHATYRGRQPTARLREYVRYPLFRMAALNTAFYEPPSEAILRAYARVLPTGYACDVKVWDRITARRFIHDPRWGNLSGQPNPDFLNATLFLESVLPPYAQALRNQDLCFVFQFHAMRGADLPGTAEWAERLDRFFSQLPREFRYAVEVRNSDLLTPSHGDVLARHGVAHVFNLWTEMPPLRAQLALPWTLRGDFTVVRALLKPGRKYADAVKRFEPFDRVREPWPEAREDLLRLMRQATARGIDARIDVDNRFEGNAPGSIRALATAYAESSQAA